MFIRKFSVVGLALTSIIVLFGFGLSESHAADKAQNVCVATNMTEAMACKDGQILVIPFAGKTTESDLFKSKSFIKVISALCDYDEHIELLAGDGITCVVQKKPNATEILSGQTHTR